MSFISTAELGPNFDVLYESDGDEDSYHLLTVAHNRAGRYSLQPNLRGLVDGKWTGMFTDDATRAERGVSVTVRGNGSVVIDGPGCACCESVEFDSVQQMMAFLAIVSGVGR